MLPYLFTHTLPQRGLLLFRFVNSFACSLMLFNIHQHICFKSTPESLSRTIISHNVNIYNLLAWEKLASTENNQGLALI